MYIVYMYTLYSDINYIIAHINLYSILLYGSTQNNGTSCLHGIYGTYKLSGTPCDYADCKLLGTPSDYGEFKLSGTPSEYGECKLSGTPSD